MQNGLPFDVKIPNNEPVFSSDLTDEEFDIEMLKAHEDFIENRTYEIDEVENAVKAELNL